MNPVPAAITITPPSYSLFPFADPFEDDDSWFTLRFPPLPVPPGFSHIGQPDSLPEPSPVCHASLSPFSVAPADSPVEKILTVGSTLVVVLSSADQVDAGVSSPGLVQSDGSFDSAADSPTDQAPVIRHSPASGRPCYREGPFVPANPHPRIGDDTGSCAYRFTTYRETNFVNHDVSIHYPQFLEWVGAPELARLLDRDSGDWMKSLSRSQAINAARR